MSSETEQASQTRGSREAYERYLRGMDASMRQKVALTAAHLLCTGRVADMGMGSGAQSDALAALYPMLEVVGVDLDATMVALARERYRRTNLRFVEGDIAEPIFEAGTLDGIFDSSVLHHVTSFNGYDYERAARCLTNQVDALRPNGVLIVRDFLAPNDLVEVFLDVPCEDGDASDDPRSCSTARLFERFANEFRSLHVEPGFELREEPSPKAGWRRFRTSNRLATEFVLRKDYREDWAPEVREEYTYFSQADFERLFARLGLRVLASTPLYNPWIIRNRFVGKVEIAHPDGKPWLPPTNYLIAGERVREGEGVRFREEPALAPLGFLQMAHYRDLRDGTVRDLVRRPHASIDVVPYFEADGDVFVIARMSYPRPILSSAEKSTALDGSTPPHYTTEPLNVVQVDKPLGQTVEEMLERTANIGGASLRSFRRAATYYPSPGGSQEEVRSVLVEVDPVFRVTDSDKASGLASTGRVRALEAEQVLRAAQVGGLPDARLELNVYDLFLQLGRDPGPWIGETIALERSLDLPRTRAAELRARPHRRRFERVSADASSSFLALHARKYSELDAHGQPLGSATLEFVAPRRLSTNTIACALLARSGDDLLIGLDDDDLPAAQCFLGNSELLVTPAWRIPKEVGSVDRARAWVQDRIRTELGCTLGECWELGGPYYPSAGMSPEVVFPLALEVVDVAMGKRPLRWVPLGEAVANLDLLADGHLRIAALRAAHALGRLSSTSAPC